MTNRKRRKKRRGKPIIAIILVVALIAVGFNLWKNNLGAPANLSNTEVVAVNIPAGSSTATICNILAEQGIVKSATSFKYYIKFSGNDGKLQAGDYQLSPSMSGEEIVKNLLSGKNLTNRFTIPEGYRAEQTAKSLSDHGFGDYDKLLNEIQYGDFNYSFINQLNYDNQGYRLEGVLFPNTYDVYANATEHEIIDKMLAQFNATMTEEYYAQMQAKGLNLRQLLTIASIIEREAKIDSDRPLISSVIYNRLAINMKLQMCSTVQYILGEPKEFLSNKDISIESPYNTYKNSGLPPGPICSPGKASIEAALYPADTNYIYFVVSEKLDGSHNFSADYSKFEKDKAAYKAALKKQ